MDPNQFAVEARWTHAIGESPEQFQQVWTRFQEDVKKGGGRVIYSAGVIGAYDLIVVVEAPSPTALSECLIPLNASGLVQTRTQTLVPIEVYERQFDKAAQQMRQATGARTR